MASRRGWKPGPTGIANKMPLAPTYLGHAVGCGRHAAPAPVEGAAEQHAEALGAIDLVDDDGADDPMQESGGEPSEVERLKKEAPSRKHFMTHLPNNPQCPTCTWAKTPRAQQRKKHNQSLKKLKPFSEPKSFGDLCTMDH
eukprot:2517966-Pyramimonas_sp.AAC.1